MVSAVANLVALVLLIVELVAGKVSGAGRQLLLAAGQGWMTDILVLALAYWDLDRGGLSLLDGVAYGYANANMGPSKDMVACSPRRGRRLRGSARCVFEADGVAVAADCRGVMPRPSRSGTTLSCRSCE